MFTDIEGSTRLLEELGQEGYREALAEHRRVVRAAFGERDGYEVDYEGDAFFYAFASAQAAVDAVAEAMGGLDGGPIRIRVGVHTGEPGLDPPKYVGTDVHLAARVMSAGHGGQVLLSRATRELLDGVEVRALGEHRLKDFAEPLSIFQLGSGSFPPLKTISNTNLPRPASSLVGREREVTDVASLIRDGTRLVTLTGPGGSGKTRVAIEAATELLGEFKAGVFWVGVAALRDPALVVETIAQTLGAEGELAAAINERELLLVVDNLEQVVEAAPQLATLVEACPNLAVLVTSRELLRVRGEVECQLLPLTDAEAVELFYARARVEPTEAVDELCRRLDGMPLALELAAARTNVLTVRQIIERLAERLDLFQGGRDADPRQMTLRATIEWSHDLLTREEKQLFARLSVFAGGCTLEGAEQVSEANLDTLQSLIEKSLLRHTKSRFWMLETIRDYALERLERSGEAGALEQAHAQYQLAMVEDAAAQFRGPCQAHAFQRVEAEIDNLRAALEYGVVSDPELLVQLAAGAGYFWLVRGYGEEGRRWLETAIRTGAGTASTRAYVRRIAGRAALTQGDRDEARRHFEAAIALADEARDGQSRAQALRGLGDVATVNRDSEQARSFFQQARAASDACGDQSSSAAIVSSLANLALTESQWEQAHQLAEESAMRFRTIGDREGEAGSLLNICLATLRLGMRDDARAALARAIEVAIDVGDPTLYATALDLLASLLADAGRPDLSAEMLGAGAEALDRVGESRGVPEQAIRDEAMRRLTESLSPPELEEALRRGRKVPPEDAFQRALAALD